ncbi:hypothetical protein PFISCL1PPCAC_26800, partial [Pristionchus fissidentatus]
MRKNVPTETTSEILEMMEGIKVAMNTLIAEKEWIDNETRKEAQLKLREMLYYAGSRKWIQNEQLLDKYHQGLIFDREDSLDQMVTKIKKWKSDAEYRKLLRKVEGRVENFHDFPATLVNAFFSPRENLFEVEAGFLGPPHYYANYPKAINYGAVGMTIGHEITHGFDPSGSKFDHAGKLRNWWSNATREKFDKLVQCVVDQYSNEPIVPDIGMNMNGDLTKGENVADLGGLKAAFRVFSALIT